MGLWLWSVVAVACRLELADSVDTSFSYTRQADVAGGYWP